MNPFFYVHQEVSLETTSNKEHRIMNFEEVILQDS